MKRFLVVSLLACSLLAAHAQTEDVKLMDPTAHPAFEVATIKPAPLDATSSGFSTEGKYVHVRNMPMTAIIAVAFNVHTSQVVGLPDWGEQRFDIRGFADVPGAPNWPQYQEMLRSLMQERLGLRFHKDTRELVRVTMQIGRGGIKFKPTTYKGIDLPDQTGNSNAGTQDWRITNNTMTEFAGFLRDFLNHPVIDQTGLTGKYDFTLKWARDDAQPNADTKGLPGLVTALQEQLGLRVESSKGPTDVIVIDHIEKPSEN